MMRAGSKDPEAEIAKLTRTYDWRTTDQDEIRLRQERAREEQPQIRNLDPAQRIFSQFEVVSRSGMTYSVELRSLAGRIFSCTCTDFRINGLGTCKHVEAVLLNLEDPAFFTIVNYEQMVRDVLEVNSLLHPDVVVLDEAQRIKNWNTKTAQAIKRLQSRYAFVLTGTPIENRIDELYSIVDFLDPAIFGPLFRFNREFYELDERGRPAEYRNLDLLHDRISPLLLRRRKADVETELPGRTDRNFFVALSHRQLAAYQDHEIEVSRLVHLAKRRPLTKKEQDKLMRELAMLRMICDTTYILDREDRTSPKVEELQRILEECLTEAEVKVVLF
jgi:hypothetical protein